MGIYDGTILDDWQDPTEGMHCRNDDGFKLDQLMDKEAPGERLSSSAKFSTRAMLTLGAICAQCGESDLNILDIEHINNDGAKERKRRSRRSMHQNIISHGAQGIYQLLCVVCHRRKTNKTAKHKDKNLLALEITAQVNKNRQR